MLMPQYFSVIMKKNISRAYMHGFFLLSQIDVSPYEHPKYITIEGTHVSTTKDITPPIKDDNTLQSPREETQISLNDLSSFSTP